MIRTANLPTLYKEDKNNLVNWLFWKTSVDTSIRKNFKLELVKNRQTRQNDWTIVLMWVARLLTAEICKIHLSIIDIVYDKRKVIHFLILSGHQESGHGKTVALITVFQIDWLVVKRQRPIENFIHWQINMD